MPIRAILRWLPLLLTIALCACKPDPQAPSTQSPEDVTVAARPARAVILLTRHLRDNDLAAFARDAVTPDLRAPLDSAWREGRTRWPLQEIPLGRRAPDTLAALSKPGAEAHFRALFDRQFAHADGEIRSTAATLGLFAVQYLRTSPTFTDDERGHYTQIVAALGRWAATAPLSDPARAHAAIPLLATAARATGLASNADFQRRGMDDSLRRLMPFLAAGKQVLAGYGLDIDASLDAMDVTLQAQTGETATVRMRYMLAGQAVDAVVDVERHDGRWYVSDFLRHAKEAAAAPAIKATTPSADATRKPTTPAPKASRAPPPSAPAAEPVQPGRPASA